MDAFLLLILAVMFGPPVLLAGIGFYIKKNQPHSAKVLFVLAVLYLIIGLGLCGGLLF